MNILDKIDKHLAPNFNTKTMSIKREKFKWTTSGSPGFFMLIDKHDLNIDGLYQREQISVNKIFDIVRNWDWALFGSINVAKRRDGSFWVFDGGHRTRAAFYRDDITNLPCMVFEFDSMSDEAKAFVARGKLITNIKSYDLHRASVVADEPIANVTDQILSKYGYCVTKDSAKKFGIGAISTMHKLVESDAELAEKVFHLFTEIAVEGEQPKSEVLVGLFTLAKKLNGKLDIFKQEMVDTFKNYGLSALEHFIKKEKYSAGKGGELVYARGILALINNRRRKKISI